MKTVKERDNLDLLQLTLELHARSFQVTTKEMHNAAKEARIELESRLSTWKYPEKKEYPNHGDIVWCKLDRCDYPEFDYLSYIGKNEFWHEKTETVFTSEYVEKYLIMPTS